MRTKITGVIIGVVALLGLAGCSGSPGTAPSPRTNAHASPTPSGPLPNVPRAVVGKPLTYQAELPNAMGKRSRPIQLTIAKLAQDASAGGYTPKRGRVYGLQATVRNVSDGQETDVASWYWLSADGNRVDLSSDFVAPNPFGTSQPVANSLGLSGEDMSSMGGGSQLGPGQHTTGYYLFDIPTSAGVLVHATYNGTALFAIDVGKFTATGKAKPTPPELTLHHAVSFAAPTYTDSGFGPTSTLRITWLSTRAGTGAPHHERAVCLRLRMTNTGTHDGAGLGNTFTAISASGAQSDPTADADGSMCPFEPYDATSTYLRPGAHATRWLALVLPKSTATVTNSDDNGGGDLFEVKV